MMFTLLQIECPYEEQNAVPSGLPGDHLHHRPLPPPGTVIHHPYTIINKLETSIKVSKEFLL